MVATLAGIERKAFVLGITLDLAVCRVASLIPAAAIFALYWSACYWITKRDPALFSILPRVLLQRRVYCPFLLTQKRRAF